MLRQALRNFARQSRGTFPILSRDPNLSRKPSEPQEKQRSVFEKNMVEKNGESTPRPTWIPKQHLPAQPFPERFPKWIPGKWASPRPAVCNFPPRSPRCEHSWTPPAARPRRASPCWPQTKRGVAFSCGASPTKKKEQWAQPIVQHLLK